MNAIAYLLVDAGKTQIDSLLTYYYQLNVVGSQFSEEGYHLILEGEQSMIVALTLNLKPSGCLVEYEVQLV